MIISAQIERPEAITRRPSHSRAEGLVSPKVHMLEAESTWKGSELVEHRSPGHWGRPSMGTAAYFPRVVGISGPDWLF